MRFLSRHAAVVGALADAGHRCDSIGKLHYRGSDDPNA